jgi:hypothetical protein
MKPSQTQAHAIVVSGIFDFSPICHPGWWLALAVLLVNDHLLKGAGILPGWLTGKLSDFAFLVVLPVLATTLLPVRLSGRRMVAFAVVVGIFVAAKVSLPATNALLAALAWVGIRWQMKPDPTDLIALLILPVSWHIAGGGWVGNRIPRRRLLEFVGMVIGAAACVATEPATVDVYHSPYFINAMPRNETVAFTWVLRAVDCTSAPSNLAASLTSDDLDDPRSATFASGQVAALDVPAPLGGAVAGVCSNRSQVSSADDCAALLVTVAGGPSVLASANRRWLDSPTSECAPVVATGNQPSVDSLALVDVGGSLAFRAGAHLQVVNIDPAVVASRPVASNGCRTKHDQIHALLDANAVCTVDSDCTTLAANIPIPGDPICNAYVNRSSGALSASLAQAKEQWVQQCACVYTPDCSGVRTLPVAVCQAGKCVGP